jgi:hypothetical protein
VERSAPVFLVVEIMRISSLKFQISNYRLTWHVLARRWVVVFAGLMVLGILTVPAWGQRAEPLPVRALVPRRTYYAGQAIPLTVRVIAADRAPEVTTPRIAEAEVTPLGWRMQPVASSGIGDVVSETNLYQFRFRIIPRKPGPLIVPPIAVKLGERVGTTPPMRMEIRGLPVSGRPAAFLGGVGPLDVTAQAQPAAVRVGQELEYRIVLIGPAARGSTRSPNLEALEHLNITDRIEPLPSLVVEDPPSRTIRYRLRPTRAGAFLLPPVAVAYFDPTIPGYLTKTTPGVPIRVVAVAAFDPSSLAYGAGRPSAPQSAGFGTSWRLALLVGVSGLGGAGVGIGVRRWLARRRADPRRLARRLARSLAERLPPDAVARRITEGLASYLAVATGRPPGVLTPEEARRGIEHVSGNAELAEAAGRLIADCDRVCYGGGAGSDEGLARRARSFFEAELGNGSWGLGKKRRGEATGTALENGAVASASRTVIEANSG